jgi:predicted  nucleic acid-binding Zn-ribbon protein
VATDPPDDVSALKEKLAQAEARLRNLEVARDEAVKELRETGEALRKALQLLAYMTARAA